MKHGHDTGYCMFGCGYTYGHRELYKVGRLFCAKCKTLQLVWSI